MIIPSIDGPLEHGWIVTFTGKKFYPFEPNISDIDIRDIAHNLSAVNRFAGSTRYPYSVAQHSCYVSMLSKHQLRGLLHDGSEAYIGDIPTPMKRHAIFAGYRQCETVLQDMIYEKFGLRPGGKTEDVRQADNAMCIIEGLSLMPDVEEAYWQINRDKVQGWEKVIPWSPSIAEEMFLRRFHELT